MLCKFKWYQYYLLQVLLTVLEQRVILSEFGEIKTVVSVADPVNENVYYYE